MTQNEPIVSDTLWYRFAKRPFDILAAALLLIVLSPVLALAALIVKITSRGPVMFVQNRAGRNGRPFRTMKFRTMRAERFVDPKELVPLDHADVTRVGKLLRRFKIDELPQLVNVLKGEMSLIGPRPTLPDQAEAYDDFRRQRLLVRPGLTGLAQVNGNATVPWDERILFDIAYVRRCGFLLDMGILVRTKLLLIVGEKRTTRPFATTRYADYVSPPVGYGVSP